MHSQNRSAGDNRRRHLFRVTPALLLAGVLLLSTAFLLKTAARGASECPAGGCFEEEAQATTFTHLPLLLQQAEPHAPDVIFHHGDVLTIEGTNWITEAIAVRDDRIMAVGSNEAVLALARPQTELVDLNGRTLMPGFVDPHDHLFNDAYRWGFDLGRAQHELGVENGITTLGDLFVNESFLADMQAFAGAGQMRIRTSAYLIYTDNCGTLQGDWYQAHPPTDVPGEMLRIGGIKIFADGGSCGAPAVSYDHPAYGMGDLWFTQSEMNDMVAALDAEGYQLAIHALGDRAVQQVLDALDALPDGRVAEMHHRIDHNAVLRPEQLSRYSEIGVTPLIFTTFPACSSFTPPPEEYRTWSWRWRELVDANPGLPIAWHSDMPWVGPSSPLLHLYSLVTPNEVDFNGETICPTPEWVMQKTLTVTEALPMMTINAAHALHREDEVGSLRAGKFADLIVLSDNPLLVDAASIKNIDVWMTMVGGNVEYCAAGQEAYCPGSPPPGYNLAWRKTVTASNALPDRPPELAVDGDVHNWWGAGAHAPQWIEIDLGWASTVRGLRLLPSQSPAGNTVHRVWGKSEAADDYVLLREFEQYTFDFGPLTYAPETPWNDVRFIKVETVSSPSWVSWREIAILGE